MSAARLKQLIAGVGIAGSLTFLFLNSQAANIEEHNRLSNDLRQMKQMDATLTEESLDSRFGLLTNYDTLTATLARLKAIETNVKQQIEARPTAEQTPLKAPLAAYTEILAQKEDLIEQFKSHNAVLKNSLQYLPVAAQQAAQGGNGAQVAGVQALLRDLLVYNINTDADLKAALTKQIETLTKAQNGYAPSVSKDVAILLAHARIVLERKALLDTLIGQIAALPTSQRGDDLTHVYDAQHQKILLRANQFQLYMYMACIALVGYVAFILFRLKQSAAAVKRANETLEQRVQERTGELAAANEDLDNMVSSMRAILEAVTDNADSVSTTSDHLASSAARAAGSAEGIAQSIKKVAFSAMHSARTSQEIARGSEQQAHAATQAAGIMDGLHQAIEVLQKESRHQRETVRHADTRMRSASRVCRTSSPLRADNGRRGASGSRSGSTGQRRRAADDRQHGPHREAGKPVCGQSPRPGTAGAGHRSHCRDHQPDRRTDESARPQRRHRGGARRGARAWICGRRLRGT